MLLRHGRKSQMENRELVRQVGVLHARDYVTHEIAGD